MEISKSCEVCQRAKQTRDSFPTYKHKASAIFDLIHCDLWGPYKTRSSCGASYFFTTVDDFSRATWVYFLYDKKGVEKIFLNFISMVNGCSSI